MARKKHIRQLQQLRANLLEKILCLGLMIPGAYKEVYRKCGRLNCWCQRQEKGHPLKRITWTENGMSRSKAIDEKDLPTIITMTENYRQFRTIQKQLSNIDEQIQHDLEQFAQNVIEETRKKGIFYV